MSLNKAHFIDRLRTSAEKVAAACNALLKERKVEQAAALAATNEFLSFNTAFGFYFACPTKMYEAWEYAYPGESVVIPQGRRSFFPNLQQQLNEDEELERFFKRIRPAHTDTN
jgi:hypothetical protein